MAIKVGTVFNYLQLPNVAKFPFVINKRQDKIFVQKGLFVYTKSNEGFLIGVIEEIVLLNEYFTDALTIKAYNNNNNPNILKGLFPSEDFEFAIAVVKCLGLIIFKDSELTLDKKRLERICYLIVKNKLNFVWSCNSRPHNLSLDLLKKMKEAGCKLISYGVESGDQKVLNAFRKGTTISDIKETFKLTKKSKIKTCANFILGGPREDKSSINKTLKLIKEMNPNFLLVNLLSAYPGTELYNLAIRNDWFIKKTETGFDDCSINASCLTTSELKRELKKLYKKFYLRPSYLSKRLLILNLQEWKMNFKTLSKLIKLLNNKKMVISG